MWDFPSSSAYCALMILEVSVQSRFQKPCYHLIKIVIQMYTLHFLSQTSYLQWGALQVFLYGAKLMIKHNITGYCKTNFHVQTWWNKLLSHPLTLGSSKRIQVLWTLITSVKQWIHTNLWILSFKRSQFTSVKVLALKFSILYFSLSCFVAVCVQTPWQCLFNRTTKMLLTFQRLLIEMVSSKIFHLLQMPAAKMPTKHSIAEYCKFFPLRVCAS